MTLPSASSPRLSLHSRGADGYLPEGEVPRPPLPEAERARHSANKEKSWIEVAEAEAWTGSACGDAPGESIGVPPSPPIAELDSQSGTAGPSPAVPARMSGIHRRDAARLAYLRAATVGAAALDSGQFSSHSA